MISGTIAEFAGAPTTVIVSGLLVTAVAAYIGATKPGMRRLE
jgi:hypothetical protein